jgi:hypothetical protein
MNSVKVNKQNLEEALITNRKIHVADYKIAAGEYKKEVIKTLEDKVKLANKAKVGEKIDCYVNLTAPENHASDYDEALSQLEWEVEPEVTLSQHEFKQLVLDDWSWKASTIIANTFYTGSASPSSVGM